MKQQNKLSTLLSLIAGVIIPREAFIKLLFKECDRGKTTLVFVSHGRNLEKLFDRTIRLNDINIP